MTTYADTNAGRGIRCNNTTIFCNNQDYYCDGSVVLRPTEIDGGDVTYTDTTYSTTTYNEVSYS
jgi:hypothetical protein